MLVHLCVEFITYFPPIESSVRVMMMVVVSSLTVSHQLTGNDADSPCQMVHGDHF